MIHFILNYAYACVMWTWVQVSEETIDPLGAGVIDYCELPHVDPGIEFESSGAFHPDCLSVNQIWMPDPSDPYPSPLPLTSAGTLPALPDSSVPFSPRIPD